MEGRSWRRGAGLVAVVAGVAWPVGFAGMSEALPAVSHAGGHLIVALAGLLSLLALLGLAAHDAGRTGGLGRTGYVAGLLGAGLVLVGNVMEGAWEWGLGWALFMLGILALLVGSALLGYATGRTGVLPRWAARTFFLAPLLAFLSFAAMMGISAALDLGEAPPDSPLMVVPFMVMGLITASWLALGAALWSGSPRAASVVG